MYACILLYSESSLKNTERLRIGFGVNREIRPQNTLRGYTPSSGPEILARVLEI